MTYGLDAEYQPRDPLAPPTNPAYRKAVALQRGELDEDDMIE